MSVGSHDIKHWWWTGVANGVWLHCIRWRLSYSYSDSESNNEETFSKDFEKVFFSKNGTWNRFGKKIRYRLGPLQSYVRKRKHERQLGHRCWQRVTGSAKVPRDWQTFLKNANNKKSFLHICPGCYRQDNCRTKKSCTSTSQKMIVWSISLKELQWGKATMKRQIPAY